MSSEASLLCGDCHRTFSFNVEALKAEGYGHAISAPAKEFNCGSRVFKLGVEIRLGLNSSADQAGDSDSDCPSSSETDAAAATDSTRRQCMVGAILQGGSAPGARARFSAAILDPEQRIGPYGPKVIELPLDNIVRNIELLKIPLKKMAKYTQINGTVNLNIQVHIRNLRPSANHCAELLNCVSAIRRSGDFSDVKLVCSGHTFRCHKVILAARSEVFAGMLKGNFREAKENKVIIDDVAPDTMESMLEYIYSGEFKKSDCSVGLLAAAHKYNIQALANECCNELTFRMDRKNICSILKAAYLYDRDFLFKYAVMFFKENKKVCMGSEDWREMETYPDLLNAILKEI